MTDVRSDQLIELSVDGMPVRVAPGTTIMQAARTVGVDIAKLCATDSLKSFGSCRLCIVQVDGRRGLPASCTTPVEPGMVVRTQTP